MSQKNKVVDLTKADPELKDFFRNPKRFADLFNGVCFGGREVLHPDVLQEMDTDVSGVIITKEYRESLVRNRDVLKKAMDGTKFVLLGIENQNTVDYIMPLRVMVYDGMNYVKEVKKIKDEKAKSNMQQIQMKVIPIVTIVMYYGTKPWNGPTSLKEMMNDIPDYLQEVVSDYKMNLVEVLHSNYVFRNEDVKMLFEYAQAIVKKDRKRIETLDKQYKLKEEVVYAIGKFIDIREAKEKLNKEQKEEIRMCELFDDIRNEGIDIGRNEGIDIGRNEGIDIGARKMVNLLRELSFTQNEILKQLFLKFGMEKEDAYKFLL